MSEPVEGDELQFREYIRDAIQAGGKSGKMSKKTGIPVGTLNKYVSLRSAPSALNALKIAQAIGMSLEELASGKRLSAPDDGSGYVILEDEVSFEIREVVDPGLIERLYIAAEGAYRDVGQPVPAHRIAAEATSLFNQLRARLTSLNDTAIVNAVLDVLVRDLRDRLRSAEPGTGKRSAL